MREGYEMVTIETIRKDVIDLDPAEFIKMKAENPDAIAKVEIIPPMLGVSEGFGKIRVTLAAPRYEVRL
jgi:hypothetical protein